MSRFINKKESFKVDDPNCLSECMAFIEDELRVAGVASKLVLRSVMLSEEVIVSLLEKADKGSEIRLQIKRIIGDATIHISSKGEAHDVFESEREIRITEELGDEETQAAIRAIMLNSLGENLKTNHKDGITRVRIKVAESENSMVRRTVIALALGLLFGLLLKFAMPAAAASAISTYALAPVKTMFMNALMIIVAPVIFFSIVTCISGFGNLSELGRVGVRVMGIYTFTSVVAIVIGFVTSKFLNPGTFGAALTENLDTPDISVDTNVDTSLLSTIVNIVPANFVKPFLENSTLQIIFLAVICGIAVGMIGEYTSILKDFFAACNSLFLTITTLIAKFIPLAVFCSVSLMMAQLGVKSFVSMLGYFGAILVGISCMLATYGLLVLLLGKVSPVMFFKNNREGMLTSFSLASSSAAMPTNMRTCTDKMGISSKVCSFSIPLGATVNMDGVCISLTITGLYLAKMYGVQVNSAMILSLAVTIILLSLGCPGVPGSGFVCLGVVLSQLGVPIEAIGLIMAINPFVDMFTTMSNTTGDVVAALITANKEGLLDREVFYDKKAV